jgi:hypothetical protein
MKPLHYLKSSNRMLLSSLCLMLSIASHSAHSATEADKLQAIKDHAENSRLVPFQGQLADAQGNPINGQVRLTFRLYTVPTYRIPILHWVEVHESISVINGFVNVLLGAMTPFNTSSTINFSQPLHLGITVGSDTSSELFPRHQLFPSFHARTAEYAETASTSLRSLTADNADNSTKLDEQPIDYFVSTPTLEHTISSLNQTIQDAISTAIANVVQISLIPVGAITIVPFMRRQHQGWIALSSFRTFNPVPAGQVPELWEFIKKNIAGFTTYSEGNFFAYSATSTWFLLPNLHGQFIRGWDHGAGIDPGRELSSRQLGQSNHLAAVSEIDNNKSSSITITSDGNWSSGRYVGDGVYNNDAMGFKTHGRETLPRHIVYEYMINAGDTCRFSRSC